MTSNFNQLPHDSSEAAQQHFESIFPYYDPTDEHVVIGQQSTPIAGNSEAVRVPLYLYDPAPETQTEAINE